MIFPSSPTGTTTCQCRLQLQQKWGNIHEYPPHQTQSQQISAMVDILDSCTTRTTQYFSFLYTDVHSCCIYSSICLRLNIHDTVHIPVGLLGHGQQPVPHLYWWWSICFIWNNWKRPPEARLESIVVFTITLCYSKDGLLIFALLWWKIRSRVGFLL